MKKLIPLIILALSLNLISCEKYKIIRGIDGRDGRNGRNGSDGEDGKDGQDGKYGANGPTLGHEYILNILFGDSAPLGHQIALRPYAVSALNKNDLATAPTNFYLIIYQPVGSNTRYVVDTSGYDPGNFTVANAQAYLDTNKRVITFQGCCGPIVVGSNTFNYYKDNNTGVYYMEGGRAAVKDLERIGSEMEAIETEELKDRLVIDYGLSQERADKVARMSSVLQKIGNKRSLTKKELNKATKELLGFNYEDGVNALNEGGDTFENLLEVAAEKNGTSPEAVQEILQDYLLR